MSVFEYIGIFTTIAGLFALIDLFPGDERKSKIANYVFGFHDLSFHEFETNVIGYLMSLFMKDGRLKKRRIFLGISLIPPFAMILFGVISMGWLETVSPIFFVVYIITMPLAWAIFTFWYDFYSMWVTRKLFVDRSPSFPHSFLFILLDIIFTILPLILFLMILFFWAAHYSSNDPEEVFWGASFWSFALVLMSLVISLVQIAVLTAGILLRVIFSLTRLNQHIAVSSDIHKAPFTFVGIILGALSVTAIAVTS